MKILRAADRAATPWKNGGGVTREVAVWPPGAGLDNFDWRVSIAEVSGAGPFSHFAGIDRTLAILEGRMALAFAERTVELDAQSPPLAFAGDVPCRGTPLGGAVTDLNVMTRRGRRTARVERITGETISTAAATLVMATDKATVCFGKEELVLDCFDAVFDEKGGAFSFPGVHKLFAVFFQ
jgi:environmental stress-induced protein Ves